MSCETKINFKNIDIIFFYEDTDQYFNFTCTFHILLYENELFFNAHV